MLEEVAGVRVLNDEEEYPALRRWAAEYSSSEAVKECLPAGHGPASLLLRRDRGEVRLGGQLDGAQINIELIIIIIQ